MGASAFFEIKSFTLLSVWSVEQSFTTTIYLDTFLGKSTPINFCSTEVIVLSSLKAGTIIDSFKAFMSLI